MGDRFVIRWPYEGHPSPLTPEDSRAWLEDTADGSEWFADGGQPEDMILCRDLRVFVDAMNKHEADLARVTAERDAAVARNIILHQQKTAEAEAARVDRVPVADYYHRVREVLEKHGVAEAVLDEVRDLPGWDGTEGGYRPGLTTSTFVYREDLVKAEAERDAIVESARKMHESHARQRDAFARLVAERDALRTEVEAMRRCVAALREHGEGRNEGEAQDAIDALDAPRAEGKPLQVNGKIMRECDGIVWALELLRAAGMLPTTSADDDAVAVASWTTFHSDVVKGVKS